MDQEITVRQGERVEIQLPATMSWSATLRDEDAILQPVEPQGAVDEQQQRREWHYLALRPGSASIIFAGRAIRKPGTKTPHFVVAQTYRVTVTA